MAKLETLKQEQYDALHDAVKEYYVQNKDGDWEPEGVGSLKRAIEAEKTTKQKAIDAAVAEALKAYEGVDLEAAKQAIADKQKAEDAKLEATGNIEAIRKQYDERIAALEAKHATDRETERAEYDATLATLKHERLANILTEKGVLPDRVKYVVHDLNNDTELIRGENGFEVRKKGGIGDAPEFDAMIEGIKTRSPFFFAADNIPGSGASGSESKGVSSNAKVVTRAQWDAATAEQRIEWGSGLTVTD